MKAAKRKRLERAGWRLVSIEEFLDLSEEEQVLVEIKLALQPTLNELKSSRSRLAKIEACDPRSKSSGRT
jgi:hypothetical protein